MTKTAVRRTQKQLGVENDELRARLDEAEETLRAIRNGDWDALVVSGVGGEQIFTLKQSELRYRRLFEAAQDGILILDAETGAITDVNPFLINMLGYSRVEFVEKKLWEVGAFKDIEASQEAFEALQANKYIRYDDMPLRAKDGRLIQVEFVSNVYLVDDKKVIQCNIRDITARKWALQALQESEERFRALVENNSGAISLLDAKGIAIYDSPAAPGMLGYEPKAWIGQDVFALIHPDHLSEIKDLFQNLVETPGARVGSTFRVRHRSGSWLWLEMVATNLLTEPAVKAIVLNYHDITERRQAEEALRENEERFRQVWETTSEAMTLSDPEGIVYAVNSAYLKLYGYKVEDVIGRSFALIFPEENREWAIEQYKIVFANPVVPPYFESLIHRADGTERIVETRVVFLTVAGQRTAMLSSIRDITERKRAEEALELTYSQLTNLYNNLPEAVFSRDVVQNKMLQASPAHEAVFGYSHDEFFKNPQLLYEMIVPEDKPIVDAGNGTLAMGKILQQQFRILRPDGETRWIEVIVKPNLAEDGKLVRLDGIASDITERKHAQEKIQKQLEHLTALSAIDQIIATNFDLRLSLSQILIHVTTELGMDAADILTLNPNSQILEFCAERGFRGRAIRKGQVRLGESYAGRVALERRLVQIPNLGAEPNNLFLTTHLMGEDFIGYYGVPLIAKGQVNGVMEVFRRTAFEPDAEWFDFLNTLAGQTAIAIESATLFESLQRSKLELVMAYDATIEGWSRALDLRDKETEGHSLRVTEMTLKLAQAFGLSEAELMQVRWGALLHDIGKMGVPDGILLKPGPLTDEEWVAMKKHPTFAYELLAPIRYLRLALDLPYCHHEKWDGTGYPRGLKGNQIPLVARIFAVVDVWDALSSDRPYRAAWTKEKVHKHILTSSGTHFDPQVVEVFLQENQDILTHPLPLAA